MRSVTATAHNSLMRSVIATAHNSPMVSGCRRWQACTKRRNVPGSKRLSVWATKAQATPDTRGYPAIRAGGQLRQLPMVAARQIVVNFANLLFDDVIAIEQPLGRQRDCPPGIDPVSDVAISVQQNRFVVPQSRRQGPPRRRRRPQKPSVVMPWSTSVV